MLKFATKDAGRPHVLEAVDVIVERYRRGELFTAIDCPPRSGKSAIIHLSALELYHVEDAPWTLAIAPWELLPDQLGDPEKVAENFGRYGTNLPTPLTVDRVRHINSHQFYASETPGVFLLCATLPLIYTNRKLVELGVVETKERFGRRPVVFVDEAHLTSKVNDWGSLVETLAESGAYVVLLTGTSIRSDGKAVPGFDATFDLVWEERLLRLRSRRVDPLTGRIRHFIETHHEESRKGAQRADYTMTWQQAWDLKLLSQTNVLFVDATIPLRDGATEEEKLVSELPISFANKHLREIVEHDLMIRECIRVGVSKLHDWRTTHKRVKMLVATGSDITKEKKDVDNYNARAVRRFVEEELRLQFGSVSAANIRVEIATTTLSEDKGTSGAATEKIKAFRGDAKAISMIGDIDVLIVKTMGLVGLDVPELKVLIDLTTLRDGPLSLQLRSRALTIYNEAPDRPADLILPKDKANQAIIERMREAGGLKEIRTNKRDEREVEPGLPGEDIDIHDAFLSGVGDHEGREEDDYRIDDDRIARTIRDEYEAARSLTDVVIIKLWRGGAFPSVKRETAEAAAAAEPSTDRPKVTRLEDETAELRGKFGVRAQKLANQIYSYKFKPIWWRKAVTDLQAGAKRRAGVNIPVAEIDDPVVLKRLLEALNTEFLEIFGRHPNA